MPKPSIEEMENSVLSATDITINFTPVFDDRWIYDSLTIRRIHKSQIIPA
jgi:hypothetical protein